VRARRLAGGVLTCVLVAVGCDSSIRPTTGSTETVPGTSRPTTPPPPQRVTPGRPYTPPSRVTPIPPAGSDPY